MEDRYDREVSEHAEQLRHVFDIEAKDCQPDGKEWRRVQDDLAALLRRAYRRNHKVA